MTGKVSVNSKSIRQNGYRTDFNGKARSEAKRVEASLVRAAGVPVVVKPGIVLICREIAIKEHPTDILVTSDRRLVERLVSSRKPIDAATVARSAAEIARPSTWI